MCGIAGIIGSSADHQAIFAMTEAQAHRGPDDHGHLFVDSRSSKFVRDSAEGVPKGSHIASLGHLRLSILDCSGDARQPMHLVDGKDWISYNGEIYNYVELRDELVSLGHRFKTTGDSEVLLASYREWGTDCFNRFNGMWAAIIWDESNRKFVLSRDRFGIKPLHYATWKGSLYLASEIKGILQATDIPRNANRNAIFEYLKFSAVNHSNETFFAHVHAFPPAHFAIIDPETPERIKPQRFWNFSDVDQNNAHPQKQTDEKFRNLLGSAVNLRMRSDVPVGSCLSGGLDSSSIVALAAEGKGSNFHTFTSCFEDKRFDERNWAELINEQMQTNAHYVQPDQKGFLSDINKLTWHQEEPFTSASIFAQWCIMRRARETGIPVLLDGQGADEVLCGYRKFSVYYLRELLSEFRLGKFLSELFSLLRHGDRGLFNLNDAQRYLPSWMRKRGKDARHYLSDAAVDEYAKTKIDISANTAVSQRQKQDLLHYSVPSLLRYEDRNSMAFSIEARVPFLDYRLADWAVNLPTALKITDGKSKAILRRAMRGTVPDAVLDRRDKMGFVTPQKLWMQEDLGKLVGSTFSKPDLRIGELVDAQLLIADSANYRADSKTINDGVLFRFFMLEIWMETFDVTF